MKTIEEMYEVVYDYCDSVDCTDCCIEGVCLSIGGSFKTNKNGCKQAYEILMGTETEGGQIMQNNVQQHMKIVTELNQLYERKNSDYGDSFHLSFLEEGMAMARIRLGDKLNRFKTLTKSDQQKVNDESIRDTLIDLANYAIMTIMEIDRKG